MKKLLTIIMTLCVCFVYAQDQISWVRFQCGDSSTVRYISLEDRKTMFKVNMSWPENETREVFQHYNDNPIGVSMGQMQGGEYFITLDHPGDSINPVIGYQSIYTVRLGTANGNHTEDCNVRTEPTPVIQATMSTSPLSGGGSLVTIIGNSHTADTVASNHSGWGWISNSELPCSRHEISIITDVFSEDGLVFSDTTICVPGVPTDFSAEFDYTGPYTMLCAESRMEKRSMEVPAEFPTRAIVLSSQTCQMAGQVPPSIELLRTCEDGTIGTPPTTGDREFLVRFNIDWPGDDEQKLLYYTVPNNNTGLPNLVSSGQLFHRGQNYIVIQHDDVDPVSGSAYFQEWHTKLAFRYGEEFIYSELFIASTEPAPVLEGSWLPTSGDSVSFSYEEHTELSEALGWGWILGICPEYELILIKRVTDSDGETVFTDTVFLTPGIPVDEEDGFLYTGNSTELCLELEMQRIHLADSVHFEPQTIITVDGGCIGSSTAISESEGVAENQTRIFPNPTTGREVRILGAIPSSKWSVFSTSGSLVLTGAGQMIDVSTLSSGVYVVNIEGGATVRLVRQ